MTVQAREFAQRIIDMFGYQDIIKVSITIDFDENEVRANLQLLLDDTIVHKYLHLFSDGSWKEKD